MSQPTHKRLVIYLIGIVLFMGIGAWVAAPVYGWMGRFTGVVPPRSADETAPVPVLDRTVTVRFDASLGSGMEWKFKPLQYKMDLRIGETTVAFYEVYNPTDRVIAGRAGFSVAPDMATPFVRKTDCPCFDLQVLQPGERAQLPVTFYIDPVMVTYPDGKYINSITLSYTFYETDLPEGTQVNSAEADHSNATTAVN